MPKFFVREEDIKDSEIHIFGADCLHISKVLRAKRGDELLLCDGKGTDFVTEITEISRESVVCSIKERHLCPAEPNVCVTLYQGLPKQVKMDYIIEKCTELGISQIVPVSCLRSVVKTTDEKNAEKKLARWRKIAAESVKQCGRGIIPQVTNILTLPEAIAHARENELVLVPYENETEKSVSSVLEQYKTARSVGIFIGPEGGFDDTEIRAFLQADIPTVTLGPRILRTETAGHTVLTAVMYAFGEMER